MLQLHEMCNRKSQGKEGIIQPGKLEIHVNMYLVHNARHLRRIHEELKALEGTLWEGEQEEGQSRHG